MAVKRNKSDGSLFWGCSKWPKCSFNMAYEPVDKIDGLQLADSIRKLAGVVKAEVEASEARHVDMMDRYFKMGNRLMKCIEHIDKLNQEIDHLKAQVAYLSKQNDNRQRLPLMEN